LLFEEGIMIPTLHFFYEEAEGNNRKKGDGGEGEDNKCFEQVLPRIVKQVNRLQESPICAPFLSIADLP